jgi:hypothetical protein
MFIIFCSQTSSLILTFPLDSQRTTTMAQSRRMLITNKAKQQSMDNLQSIKPTDTIVGPSHSGKTRRAFSHRGNNENQRDVKSRIEGSSHTIDDSTGAAQVPKPLKVVKNEIQSMDSLPAKLGRVNYEIRISLPKTNLQPTSSTSNAQSSGLSEPVEMKEQSEMGSPHNGETCKSPEGSYFASTS